MLIPMPHLCAHGNDGRFINHSEYFQLLPGVNGVLYCAVFEQNTFTCQPPAGSNAILPRRYDAFHFYTAMEPGFVCLCVPIPQSIIIPAGCRCFPVPESGL